MKTKSILILWSVAALLCISAAVILHCQNVAKTADANAQPGRQVFQVKGVVRGLDVPAKTIRITHEEIPDYMPAMTMPFSITEAKLLEGLAAGDAVRFRFVVTEDDSWIDQIEKTGAGTARFAESVVESSGPHETDRVQTGERVPEFTLTNQDGKRVQLSDYKGKAVVLTFIYTRCPIPNFCPRMSNNFAELQQRLRDEFGAKAQLLSITMDPEFDTPAVLKDYATRYDADHATWTFATGTREQTDYAGSLFGLIQESVGGLINHDLRTVLISPEGRMVHLWKSNVWTPYEVQRMVRETLTQSKTVATR